MSKDAVTLLNLIEDYVRFGFRVEHKSQNHVETLPANVSQPPETHGSGETSSVLSDLAGRIDQCTGCALHKNRQQSVPGEGCVTPLVLVVGEGPGTAEDRSGRPFVGPAGQYLDKWLAAVKIGKDEVPLNRNTNTFIANIVKCRPPNNRDPQPEEISVCLPYLEKQIGILKPRAVLCVGRIALQTLTNQSTGIGAGRGKVYTYKEVPLVPTYHPSAVLRNPELRAPVWEDLKLLKSVLENEQLH